MFALIITFIVATGGSSGTGSFTANHQVLSDQWGTKEACEEAARIITANHREIATILENSRYSDRRHGGPHIRTACVPTSVAGSKTIVKSIG